MVEKQRRFQRVFGKTTPFGLHRSQLFVSVDEMKAAFGLPERLKVRKPRVTLLWDFEKRNGTDGFVVFARNRPMRDGCSKMWVAAESKNDSLRSWRWLVNRLVERQRWGMGQEQ
jgi:hypothetical protein